MIFCTILLTIYKIFYYKVRVSTGSVDTRWLGGSFLTVYRNNATRLGSGFISVCLETRWLGHLGGFYVLERPCTNDGFADLKDAVKALQLNMVARELDQFSTLSGRLHPLCWH